MNLKMSLSKRGYTACDPCAAAGFSFGCVTGVTLQHNEQIRKMYLWKHIIALLLTCSRARDITGNDKGVGGLQIKGEQRWIEERH